MLAHKYHPDISTTLRIQDLFSKYKEYEGEASPPQPRQIIRLVKFRLEKLFRKLKDESIKKKKEKITKRYATQQKKTIKNIMGGTIEWDGVQFVRLESSVITKPDEIKEEVYKYYKNKTTPQQDRPDVEKPDGFDEIYEPDPDLEETMWDKLLDPITTEETLDTINNLPSGKAPGGNGITYDIIKLLFSKNEINLAALTQLLNYSIKTGLFPRNGSKGIITLLPKIHSWSGQLAKTRPITLLDSHRKIFEAILNKRMSTIIYGNNMLKGVNFGFSPGVGTTESIAMIKHIIDISNIRGSTLHAAILDVQAAYDTVPHSAVYESLKKMKAPIELINLLSNLDSNRSLQIDTPFGLTKPFHPILGLAQGSILSPLLWNIFYNPLLCLLQKKTVGIKVLESRITAIAYADDIHPVASTNADLQLQLNIIHDFLLVHGMSMNVAKTHILSNEAQSSENYPADLSMGTTQITSYKGRSEISRILGVYISMDGSSKETIKQAIETLDSQITRLNIKFMPSRVAINIINSVILPKLAFRLQVANIPITTLRKIDAKLRKLTKKKCSLPLNTPNDFLYDKSYGFSLNSIESILPSQLISNTMAMLRSHGNIGSFLHEVERFYQAQLKTPMSIFASPLPFGTKGKSGDSLAKQISNTLYKNKFQIRGLHHFDPAHHFTQILSIDEYVNSYKNIAKLNLNNLEDFIQTKSSGVRETRASRSNSNKTRSFNIIDEGLDQKNLKRPEKYLDEQAIGCIAPKWFSQIICHLTKQQFKNIHKDELFDIPNPVNDQHPSIETSLTNEHNILSAEVYVDGSFKTGEMGSAALFHSKYTNVQEELPKRAFVLSKPTHHNASIEKAEKWALLKGLEPFDSKTKLNIYSDSDITINAVALIMNDQLSSRNILKIEDYPIIEKIKHEMNRFETRPILHKVKSHSGHTIHDEVDALSKQARAEYTLPYTDITPYKIGTSLDRDLHLYISEEQNPHRLDSYPRSFLSRRLQNDLKVSNIKRLERRWVPGFQLPDYQSTTTALTLALDRDDHLDCSNYQVHSFRIGCINKNLQTLDKLQTYSFWNRNESKCVMCDDKEEEQDHIFECKHVKDNINDLKSSSANFARQEIQKRCAKKNAPYNNSLEIALQEILNTFFQDSPDNFLASPEARGLLTPNSNERAAKSIETITLKIKLPSKNWLLSLVSASWTRALYELYWKPRTCILFRENHEATKAKEKALQRAQRDINTARAKAKALTKRLIFPTTPNPSTKPKQIRPRPIPATNNNLISPSRTNQSPRNLRAKSATIKQNITKADQTLTNKLIKTKARAGQIVHQTTPKLNLNQNPDTLNFIHEPPDKIVK